MMYHTGGWAGRTRVGETGMTSHLANYPDQPFSNEEMLDALQRDAFGYFLSEINPLNGLVADKTQAGAPAEAVQSLLHQRKCYTCC